MFSQLTQLASKFSLDNLQDGDGKPPVDTDSSSPIASSSASGVLSAENNVKEEIKSSNSHPSLVPSISANNSEKSSDSIFSNLGFSAMLNSTSLSSPGPGSPTKYPTSPTVESPEVNSLRGKLQNHENDIKGLHDELSVVTKALDTATKQLYEVREELSIEKAAHKDTQGRYQQALGSSRSHQGMIASLNQNIEVLQESLSLEKAKSESLTLQLTELQEKYDVSFKARENIDLGSNSQDAIAESSITESSNLKLSQLQQQLNLMQQRMTESTALFRSQVEAANLATSSAASRVSDLESEVLELHAQLATKKTELESMNCVINAGNKEIAELIAQVAAANEKNELDTKKISSEKDERIAELTSKLASLTEKAKDYVKKYSDAKQQIANLETSNTKLASDLAASNQTKDSELTSLRLKLEAQTVSMASSKSASDELSERCDELTRELQRCRLALQDSKNTVEVLERDAHEHETTLRDAQDTISKLEESLKSSTEMQRAQMTSLERKFQSEIEDLKADLFNTRSALADAKRDVEMLQQDKESSESAAKNLDEYKKKAQAALKKSAESVTSLSAEISELKKAIEHLNGERTAIQSKHDTVVRDLQDKAALVDGLKSEIEVLQMHKSESNQCIEALENTVKSLQDQLSHSTCRAEELASTLAVAKSVQPSPAHGSDVALSPNVGTHESSQIASPERDSSATKVLLPDASRSHPMYLVVPGESSPRIPIRANRQRSQHNYMQEVSPGDLVNRSLNDSDVEGLDDSMEFPEAGGNNLFYTNELLRQVEDLRASLVASTAQCDSLRSRLDEEVSAKKNVSDKLEECLAFLERAKKLQNGPESAINMEYLKNCVLHYMLSTGVSERLRLYPVIGTILKLTSTEMAKIAASPLHVDSLASSIELADSAWSNIAGFASTSLTGWFGGSDVQQT